MSRDAMNPTTLSGMAGAGWLQWPQTCAVFAALTKEGDEARAVGGAVRNTLLGRAVSEVDIATTATTDKVIALAQAAGLKAVATGIEHGTVTVIVDGQPFEVTTLRKDVETYGRHAKVAFTDDWTADASRRDFTINAIYAGPDGTLFDPIGGLADIEAHRIRFIGDPAQRIREDYLRILRFFRFNAEYGDPPYDRPGLAACVAEREGLARLSPERICKELMKLLRAPGAVPALEAMFDYGLLVDVLGGVPYLRRLDGLVSLEEGLRREPDAVLRLGALAVAVPEDADRLRDRFRLSNANHARLRELATHTPFGRPPGEHEARLALYRSGQEGYRDRIVLAWAGSGAAADDPDWQHALALPERAPAPQFPLRGQDLIELGMPAGPRVGQLLKRLETAWIDGGLVADREALMASARTLLNQSPEGDD